MLTSALRGKLNANVSLGTANELQLAKECDSNGG